MIAPKIKKSIEYKAIGSEIKATSEGIVEGYLNRTGIIDSGGDKSLPGCFKKTLADSYARKAQQSLDYLWPFLYNHSYAELPVGGIFYGEEDRKGLFIKVQMNMDIQSGREVFASFKNGTLSKFSMGYKTVLSDWEKFEGQAIRLLKEVAVMEGSCVVFPMNDESIATAVKNNRRYFIMNTKGTTMDIHSKDYAESLMQTNQSDWISDLWNLWYPLRNEILTAFQTGDTIEQDVQSALAQFAPAVLAYVQHGIELNMTDCLQPSDDGDSGSMPMMMSSDDNPETKDVKLLSAASHAKMMKAVGGLEGHVKELKSELSRQRANALQGYQVYSGKEPPEQKEDDDQEEDETEQKQEQVEDIHSVLHDLTLLLSADNANRGV